MDLSSCAIGQSGKVNENLFVCFKLIYFQRVTHKQYCLSWRSPTRWILVLYNGVWPEIVIMLYELSDAFKVHVTDGHGNDNTFTTSSAFEFERI